MRRVGDRHRHRRDGSGRRLLGRQEDGSAQRPAKQSYLLLPTWLLSWRAPWHAARMSRMQRAACTRERGEQPPGFTSEESANHKHVAVKLRARSRDSHQ